MRGTSALTGVAVGIHLYVIIPFVVFLVFIAVLVGGRKLVMGYVGQLYDTEQYDELVDFLDTAIAKFLYPRYNRTYAKFNAYLAMGDAEKCGRALDELLTMQTSGAQRRDLIVKAFEFYMNTGRYKDAKALLPEIDSLGDEALARRTELTYDVIARKSYSHIAEMEEEIAGDVSHARKIELSYLLSLQYRNKGDEKTADTWKAEAEKLLGMSL